MHCEMKYTHLEHFECMPSSAGSGVARARKLHELDCNSQRLTLNCQSSHVHLRELLLDHVINFTVNIQGIVNTVAIDC